MGGVRFVFGNCWEFFGGFPRNTESWEVHFAPSQVLDLIPVNNYTYFGEMYESNESMKKELGYRIVLVLDRASILP